MLWRLTEGSSHGTPGIVKLLMPPRRSRGVSRLRLVGCEPRGRAHNGVSQKTAAGFTPTQLRAPPHGAGNAARVDSNPGRLREGQGPTRQPRTRSRRAHRCCGSRVRESLVSKRRVDEFSQHELRPRPRAGRRHPAARMAGGSAPGGTRAQGLRGPDEQGDRTARVTASRVFRTGPSAFPCAIGLHSAMNGVHLPRRHLGSLTEGGRMGVNSITWQ